MFGRETMHISTTEKNKASFDDGFVKKYHTEVYTKLMPLLIIVYIISYIYRTNIGIAKATMGIDIGLSVTAYGLGAGLFFLIYSTCEIPINLMISRVGARFRITRIMITWGIISAGMAFVQGPISFYVMRLLLGAIEASLYLGVILYFGVYSLIYFLPSIISNYGKMSTFTLGLLSAIPWIAMAFGGFVLPRYVKTARKSQIILSIGFMSMAIGFFIGAIGGPILGMIEFCISTSMFFCSLVHCIYFSSHTYERKYASRLTCFHDLFRYLQWIYRALSFWHIRKSNRFTKFWSMVCHHFIYYCHSHFIKCKATRNAGGKSK